MDCMKLQPNCVSVGFCCNNLLAAARGNSWKKEDDRVDKNVGADAQASN